MLKQQLDIARLERTTSYRRSVRTDKRMRWQVAWLAERVDNDMRLRTEPNHLLTIIVIKEKKRFDSQT